MKVGTIVIELGTENVIDAKKQFAHVCARLSVSGARIELSRN
jgi:hypothetical protein